MEVHDVEVLEHASDCGGDILTMRFGKPPGYRFLPGQFLMLGVQTQEGPESKPFTIASAPDDAWLEVTTRMSTSPFKQALSSLVSGDTVTISAATGRLTLPSEPGRIGFLVGGIGITPARSILRDAVLTASGLDATLFYGNRDETCIPYAEELDPMVSAGIKVVPVLQEPAGPWEGERGFINSEVVRRHADEYGRMLWLVCGPPAMVEAMVRVLDELAVPDGRRMVERFTGYA